MAGSFGRCAQNPGVRSRPAPTPKMQGSTIYSDFLPNRWILVYYRLTVATHLRRLRNLMARNRHGGGFRRRRAKEFAILHGSARIWQIRFDVIATAVYPFACSAQDGVRFIRIVAYGLGTSRPGEWLDYGFATFGPTRLLESAGEKKRSGE